MLSGSCLCGAVRYEIDAPIESASHCHCSQCRKAHGAAFATYGKVRREAFRYVAGADAVAEYHSSPGVTRIFCRHCGSNLQWLGGNEDPTYTSIALGTLDSPLPSVAQRHIYVGSKADWYVIADDLPQEHQY
ncbi:GFA family protein [Pseudomonas aeruginosa]|nr:GFA family protein [Pseudomonas aeruginosa]